MGRTNFISMAVIRRLPRYYRYINEMYQNGVKQISSKELAECMELTASQVRQDFNCFGDFGQQGQGYDVTALHREISSILGLDEGYSVIFVGAGRLCCSLVENFGFSRRGFKLLAAFDIDRNKVGKDLCGLSVYHVDDIEKICGKLKPDIGILAVPRANAPMGAEYLKKAKVKAIWNFTNAELGVPEDKVIVENVHLSDSLMTLCYKLNELEDKLYG